MQLIEDPVRRYPSPRSRSWLETTLNEVRDDGRVTAILAIGSAVRPQVNSSDLDIIVILDEPKLGPHFRAPIEVDLHEFSASEVIDLILGGNDLLGWAATFGVALFERADYWQAVLDKVGNSLPLPSVEKFDQRARQALRRFEQVLAIGDEDAALEQATSYLTHVARALLIRSGTYPASRPELPKQLRKLRFSVLAS